MNKTLKLEDFKANTKEWFLEQLANMSALQAMQTISDLYDELHKPEYPKTYEECCEMLGSDPSRIIVLSNRKDIIHEKNKHCYEMYNLYQLLICRDAYWKIAGEQKGLGKPWEPDFSDDSPKYNIFNYENEITLSDNKWSSRILAFPTIEMRNAFYENFKYLIELCKELL